MRPDKIPMTPTAEWYIDGLHWLGGLLDAAADYLDAPSIAPEPTQPRPQYLAADEYLSNVRHRMMSNL
jgi:hypothetical protein